MPKGIFVSIRFMSLRSLLFSIRTLELVSQPLKCDQQTGQMEERQVHREMPLPAHDQAAEVAQPGEGPLHLPAPTVAAQLAPILSGWPLTIATVWDDPHPILLGKIVRSWGKCQLNPALRQTGTQGI